VFTRCIQIQQACRQSPPNKLTSKRKRNLLFYSRVNLRSLDDLGQIVRFVLGAPEQVLSALVRVCGLFYNDRLRFRLRTRLAKFLLVRRWRRNLGLLRRSAEKSIAQCVTIRTQKIANMPAKTPAHAQDPSQDKASTSGRQRVQSHACVCLPDTFPGVVADAPIYHPHPQV